MKKIVITGATHSGKSTIIKGLESKGYIIVPEAALQITEERIKEIGAERLRKEKLKDSTDFITRIADRQLKLESDAEDAEIVFIDRGYHDCIAFFRLFGLKVPQEISEIAKQHTYDIVFCCENLSNFKPRKETGRIITKEQSQRLGNLLVETYKEYGYQPITINDMATKERIKFIEENISV